MKEKVSPLLVSIAIIAVIIALLSQSKSFKTFAIAVYEGKETDWKGFVVPTNYEYLTWEANNDLVINKIRPNFNGWDSKNILAISDNAEYWRNLLQSACTSDEELCQRKHNGNYLATTSLVNGYQITNTTDTCDMVVHYRGEPSEFVQYKDLVSNLFKLNCK